MDTKLNIIFCVKFLFLACPKIAWNMILNLSAFSIFPHTPIAKILHIVLAVWALCQMYACSENNIHSPANEPTALVKAEVDSLFRQFDHYSINKPDSAILFAAPMEEKLNALGQREKLISLYTLLSELYQYKKNDDSKALHFMANALDVIGSLPDIFYSNPYFYVNIGNILFRYEMYAEAIKTYTEASRIAILTENPYAIALAFNNIALCHENQNRCDSARLYFAMAESYIPDKYDIMEAEHYIYLISLALQCGDMDSVQVYANKTGLIFKHLEADFKQKLDDNKAKKLHALDEDKLALNLNVGIYFLQKHNLTESAKHFNVALDIAKTIHDPYSIADVYLKLADLNNQSLKYAIADKYADSAADHVNLNTDLKTRIKQNRLLASLYSGLHKQKKSDSYQSRANELSDTLKTINAKEEVTRGKIKLTQARLDLVIQQNTKAQKLHIATITSQKQLIWLMVAVLIVIVAALAGLAYFYYKLKQTQRRLALRTIEIINNEKPECQVLKTATKHTPTDHQICELKQFFIDEKPHLNNNLNLNQLAERLKTNQTYLSQIINQHYGVNFNEFVNSERIKEACLIIQQQNSKTQVTIDHLFSMVGFSSKSAFYTAFQKNTGLTPAAYVKLHRKSIDAHYQ
jgi:AraC-like DNA-binding protein